MRLAQRLLLSALLVVGILVVFILAAVDVRLRADLLDDVRVEMAREAAAVGALWDAADDPRQVAAEAGAALQRRVTLLDGSGRTLGDSREQPSAAVAPPDLRALPEVAGALRNGLGSDIAGVGPDGEELRVAVRAPNGVVRVAYDLSEIGAAFDAVRRVLLAAGAAALALAAALAWAFARDVARPVLELRDVARALAAGDLTRRPSLVTAGEVGDLADALNRLAEQLAGRLEALKAEEALLAALTESLNEGVVALDPRQRVVRINEQGRRLLGVRATVPFALDHLPRERALRDALAAALRGEATDAAEATIGGRTLLVAARPLPEGGAVLAAYDLTPVRRLESMRRDFVANVSHELRTPLTIVGGFAETLADDDLPTAQRRQFAETIRVNALRMQRIVDDLLDLARIESGGWVPKPEALGVEAAAREAIAAASGVAAAKGIGLRAEVPPSARTVWADPTALRQLLANLVDNALRHTSAGEVVVFAEPGVDGAVRVGVRDTGSGIPAEHLSRVFERFYRVDPARSREAGGTGLGLSIVRHLVEAHGGRVTAESTVGAGTTITAIFPAAPPPAGAAAPPSTTATPA